LFQGVPFPERRGRVSLEEYLVLDWGGLALFQTHSVSIFGLPPWMLGGREFMRRSKEVKKSVRLI
jgi:hypothetical protein